MTLKEALTLVSELAEEGMLTAEQVDGDSTLEDERAKQREAIDAVDTFIATL